MKAIWGWARWRIWWRGKPKEGQPCCLHLSATSVSDRRNYQKNGQRSWVENREVIRNFSPHSDRPAAQIGKNKQRRAPTRKNVEKWAIALEKVRVSLMFLVILKTLLYHIDCWRFFAATSG